LGSDPPGLLVLWGRVKRGGGRRSPYFRNLIDPCLKGAWRPGSATACSFDSVAGGVSSWCSIRRFHRGSSGVRGGSGSAGSESSGSERVCSAGVDGAGGSPGVDGAGGSAGRGVVDGAGGCGAVEAAGAAAAAAAVAAVRAAGAAGATGPAGATWAAGVVGATCSARAGAPACGTLGLSLIAPWRNDVGCGAGFRAGAAGAATGTRSGVRSVASSGAAAGSLRGPRAMKTSPRRSAMSAMTAVIGSLTAATKISTREA
ncbi:MAG: hypothetical protein QOI98_3382, partial [Solirubrobacteraceae bacterium]|nr:hypothetical protein [Solirubrobacteraceae bacterium]